MIEAKSIVEQADQKQRLPSVFNSRPRDAKQGWYVGALEGLLVKLHFGGVMVESQVLLNVLTVTVGNIGQMNC